MAKKKMAYQTQRTLTGWAFISPWVIGFLAFTVFPIVYSIVLSFNKVNFGAGETTMEWAGFANFVNALGGGNLSIKGLLVNFLKDELYMVFIINVFAILFAILLNTDIKGRGILRTIFFLPVVVVSGPIMQQLEGALTIPNLDTFSVVQIIGSTFGESVMKLIVDIFTKLIEMFWYSGVQLIIYLSMLQKMDKAMYEAAQMDGASPWESFWKITLPALKPVILINMVYTFIVIATFDSNPIILAISKAINNGKEVPGSGPGLASAYAWIYFALMAIIVAIIFFVFTFSRKKHYGFSFNRDRLGLPMKRYESLATPFANNNKVKKVKKVLYGRNFSDGLIAKTFTYVLLGIVAFAFLYPFITMLLKSLQSPDDVLNPMIGVLPTGFYYQNFIKAFEVLDFWKSLGTSVLYSLVPTVCQVIAACFVGYGLARFQFKGKMVVFALVVLTFLVPSQITMIPTFMMYVKMGLIGNILTLALPALLGQGLKSAIFILIFYQSFAMIPKELDEAAYIDGANSFKIFYRVAIPLSIPIIIVGFIFSLVWYWNETTLTNLFLNGGQSTLSITTLPMALSQFERSFAELTNQNGGTDSIATAFNQAILMAGTLVSMIPLLLLYFVLQRWFVEGIDRAGLTGL